MDSAIAGGALDFGGAVDDLVKWLGEQVDDDFEAARLVLGINLMVAYQRGKPVPRWVPSPEGDAGIWDTDGTPRVRFVWAKERDHIVRHDPARVLREIEAKRQALAHYERIRQHTRQGDEAYVLAEGAVAKQIQIMASTYDQRPGYLEKWRP
jgi:hypothetical protein